MNFLTLTQFTEMWKLQDALNTATSGPDWKEKNQNWNLAIKDEVMEFFKYIGWKWWKEPEKVKSPTDMQARLELVDIWHFLLSSMIEYSEDVSDVLYSRYKDYAEVDSNNLEGCLVSIQELDSLHINNCNKVTRLSDALQYCEWSWEELYKAYIGKVALNNFRQANGYKEGTYQKIWQVVKTPIADYPFVEHHELEDNYFLERILAELSLTPGALTYEAVYHKLSIEYLVAQN